MHRPQWKPLKAYIFFDADIKILMHFSQPMKSFAPHLGRGIDVGQRTFNIKSRKVIRTCPHVFTVIHQILLSN